MASSNLLGDAESIVARGEHIYTERYRQDYEQRYPGHFVAVDVVSGEAYVEQFAEEALEEARLAAPGGIYHLIRIGSPGAFKVSRVGRRHGIPVRTR